MYTSLYWVANYLHVGIALHKRVIMSGSCKRFNDREVYLIWNYVLNSTMERN